MVTSSKHDGTLVKALQTLGFAQVERPKRPFMGVRNALDEA